MDLTVRNHNNPEAIVSTAEATHHITTTPTYLYKRDWRGCPFDVQQKRTGRSRNENGGHFFVGVKTGGGGVSWR